MLKKYRETNAGIEYWDTEEKRIVVLNEEIKDTEQQEISVDTTGINLKETSLKVTNLEEMTVKELKDFAESQGIDIPKSMTKRELVIEKIVGAAND